MGKDEGATGADVLAAEDAAMAVFNTSELGMRDLRFANEAAIRFGCFGITTSGLKGLPVVLHTWVEGIFVIGA